MAGAVHVVDRGPSALSKRLPTRPRTTGGGERLRLALGRVAARVDGPPRSASPSRAAPRGPPSFSASRRYGRRHLQHLGRQRRRVHRVLDRALGEKLGHLEARSRPATFTCASPVCAPRCGVQMTCSSFKSGWSGGGGLLLEHVERRAPPPARRRSPRPSAVSSTMPAARAVHDPDAAPHLGEGLRGR